MLRMSSTPACACPARKKLRCSSLAGARPSTTRFMNRPPLSTATRESNKTPTSKTFWAHPAMLLPNHRRGQARGAPTMGKRLVNREESDMEFDTFVVQRLLSGPTPPTLTEAEANEQQDAHLAHIADMWASGKLIAAGPASDGERLRGLERLRLLARRGPRHRRQRSRRAQRHLRHRVRRVARAQGHDRAGGRDSAPFRRRCHGPRAALAARTISPCRRRTRMRSPRPSATA